MTTEQRLERLERENRWMRRIGAVGVAVALGALAAALLVERGPAQTHQPSQLGEEFPDLEVRSLTVKDEDGKARVCLATGGGVALMTLLHKDGKSGVALTATPLGAAAVNLIDKDGKPRATLGTLADGSPALRLLNAKGKVIWKAPKD